MNISELTESKYLKQQDCDPPLLVTIEHVERVNVAQEGKKPDYKWAMHLKELDKPMIVNPTNGQLIAQITGSEESEEWNGQQIVLYKEPNVSYGGKLTGGIRVRAPKKQNGTASKRPPVQEEPEDDEIPF